MKSIRLALAIALVAAATSLNASDRVGVYGVIEKVVFEPNAENPERVQLWGAFAIATRTDRNYYEPVATGYLYYKLPGDARMARVEWRDLQALAGTKRIAGFATRFEQSVRVRAASEAPQTPDTYALGIGVQTIHADRDYAPIKALAAHLSR